MTYFSVADKEILRQVFISADWLQVPELCKNPDFSTTCENQHNWKLKLRETIGKNLDETIFIRLDGKYLERSLEILAFYGLCVPGTEKYLDWDYWVNWNIERNNPEYLDYFISRLDENSPSMNKESFRNFLKLGNIKLMTKYIEFLQNYHPDDKESLDEKVELIAQGYGPKFSAFLRKSEDSRFLGSYMLNRVAGRLNFGTGITYSLISFWVLENPLDQEWLDNLLVKDPEFGKIVAWYYGIDKPLDPEILLQFSRELIILGLYDKILELLKQRIETKTLTPNIIVNLLDKSNSDKSLLKMLVSLKVPKDFPIMDKELDFYDLHIISSLLKEIRIHPKGHMSIILATNWKFRVDAENYSMDNAIILFLDIKKYIRVIYKDIVQDNEKSSKTYKFVYNSKDMTVDKIESKSQHFTNYMDLIEIDKTFDKYDILEFYADNELITRIFVKDLFDESGEMLGTETWGILIPPKNIRHTTKGYKITNVQIWKWE